MNFFVLLFFAYYAVIFLIVAILFLLIVLWAINRWLYAPYSTSDMNKRLSNLVPEIKLPPYKITEYSSIYVGGDDLKNTYQIVFKNGKDEILKSKLDSLVRINSKWKKSGNEYAYDTIFWEDEVVDSIIVRPLEGTATFIKYKW